MALPAHTLWVRSVALKVTSGSTVRLNFLVLEPHDGLLWSLVAVMVTSNSPAAVGVPLIVTVPFSSV